MVCALGAVPPGPAAICSIWRTDCACLGENTRMPAGRLGVLHHRHRDQLAVAREHGVGARELEQRGRQAVAVAHGRLLDRAPGLVGAQPAGDGARELQLRLLPEADRWRTAPTSRAAASACAILTVPTLLDFWITSATVSRPCGCASRIVLPVMVIQPGAVWIGVAGVTRPVSSARRTTKGFIVEPGSKVSVSARLRSCAPVRLRRSPGVEARVVGQRQHLAGLHVEHHHAAGLGLVLGHRVAHALVGEELHLGVDATARCRGRRPGRRSRRCPRPRGRGGP